MGAAGDRRDLGSRTARLTPERPSALPVPEIPPVAFGSHRDDILGTVVNRIWTSPRRRSVACGSRRDDTVGTLVNRIGGHPGRRGAGHAGTNRSPPTGLACPSAASVASSSATRSALAPLELAGHLRRRRGLGRRQERRGRRRPARPGISARAASRPSSACPCGRGPCPASPGRRRCRRGFGTPAAASGSGRVSSSCRSAFSATSRRRISSSEIGRPAVGVGDRRVQVVVDLPQHRHQALLVDRAGPWPSVPRSCAASPARCTCR